MPLQPGPRTTLAVALLLLVGAGVLLVFQGDAPAADRASVPAPVAAPMAPPAGGPSASPTRGPTTTPAPQRLAVSRPRPADRRVFRAAGARPGAPRASRAPDAHPERAAFVPATVRFGAGSDAPEAPVDRVGTLPDGSLELPEDPARIGWWAGGAQAGTPYGSVVVAGHLDSRLHGVGFAARMTELTPGDTVVLADEDRERAYRVRSRYLLPRTRGDALAELFSERGPARLVMITCGGDYDEVRGSYSDNLVVEAVPLER